jgi:adenylate cyclase class 2
MILRALSEPDARQHECVVEVEARFIVDEDALPRLEAHGLIFSDPVVQDDQAYAPAGWAWGDDRIGVPFARLRTQLGRHLFTVKRPITDVRTCLERECEVTDRAAMHDALELMGFAPTVRIVKSRRTARAGDVSFYFDELETVGTFVEIEVLANRDDDLTAVREQLEDMLNSMGVPAERCTLSYDTLVYESGVSELADCGQRNVEGGRNAAETAVASGREPVKADVEMHSAEVA